jgi:hypothetical protein
VEPCCTAAVPTCREVLFNLHKPQLKVLLEQVLQLTEEQRRAVGTHFDVSSTIAGADLTAHSCLAWGAPYADHPGQLTCMVCHIYGSN